MYFNVLWWKNTVEKVYRRYVSTHIMSAFYFWHILSSNSPTWARSALHLFLEQTLPVSVVNGIPSVRQTEARRRGSVRHWPVTRKIPPPLSPYMVKATPFVDAAKIKQECMVLGALLCPRVSLCVFQRVCVCVLYSVFASSSWQQLEQVTLME